MKSPERKLSVGLLFDDTLDSNDGVAQQVKRLGEYLAAGGHKVVYLCGQTKLKEWSGGKVYSLSRNIHIKFNGNRMTIPLWPRRGLIQKVLRQEQLDVIHVQMPYSPLMAQKVIRSAPPDCAIVATFHILPSGWLAGLGSRVLGIIQHFSLKKIDAFIAVSNSAAAFATRAMGIKAKVIPNMVDLGQFAAAAKTGNEPGKIVFLGRLVPRKGAYQLIRAFAQLANSHPQAQLVVGGNGPDRQRLEKLASRLGIEQKVTFLGFVSEEDKPRLLASAEIACFPALYGESFGIVLIEAMAAGAGVVLAGDNPGYRCVMQQRPETLIDPRNTTTLAAGLAKFLDNPSLRRQIHSWQKEHVKQYDMNIVGQRVVDFYLDAIAKKNKTRHN